MSGGVFHRRLALPAADALCGRLKALCDPFRMQILSILAQTSELSLTEIHREIDALTQPTVSHHMRILADAGFVDRRRDGRYVMFSLIRVELDDFTTALRPPL